MSARRGVCAAVLASVVSLAGTARAQPGRAWSLEGGHLERDPRSAATTWDYARDPGLRRAEELAVSATSMLLQMYIRGPVGPDRATALAGLRAMFTDAVARAPTLGPALLGLAEVMSLQGDYASELDVLTRARAALADGPELPGVLFRLGVVLTRHQRYDETREVYEQYVGLPVPPRDRAVGLCNLAETYLALEDLTRAVATFQACVNIGPDNPGAWWGLASALDRDGRGPEAERAARDALNRDPEWAGIRGPNVFWVPAYEVYYYEALARHAQNEPAEELATWQRYLAEGGARGPFARRARAHVEDLRAAMNPVVVPRARRRR